MSHEIFHNRIQLCCGDAWHFLRDQPDGRYDAIVTDPPYALNFMGKQWDTGETAFAVEFWQECLRVLKPGGHVVAFSGTRTYHRMACAIEDAGFEVRDMLSWLYGSGFPKSHDVSKGMDKAAGHWRGRAGEITIAQQVAKGTEYERRDKGDPITDDGIQWQGWGTALKPAQEKICFAQKPNVFGHDYDMIGSQIADLESSLWSMLPAKIAEQNFGLSRSEFDAACASAQWSADERNNTRAALSEAMGTARFVLAITSCLNTVSSWKLTWAEGSRPANTLTTETELSTTIDLRTLKFCLSKITPASIMQAHKSGLWSIANASTAERIFDATLRRLSGILEHSALAFAIAQEADNSLDVGAKIGDSPICFARKPLSEGTVAANVLRWGTGAINVDGCRVGTLLGENTSRPGSMGVGSMNRARVEQGSRPASSDWNGTKEASRETLGRWPANVVHDGSAEVLAGFPESAPASSGGVAGWQRNGYVGGQYEPIERTGYDDNGGSAARFFYTSKADADDRLGSKHPTVKPVDLMQWLCRLVTPPGGLVLDPFAGTGTTGEAAWREGMRAMLIEREADYQADIRRRMALLSAGPVERLHQSIKAMNKPIDYGPLFQLQDQYQL